MTGIQQSYVAAVSDAAPTFEQSRRSMPIATRDAPEHICGVAHRVGRTGDVGGDLAIYRLKLKVSLVGIKAATLPGFFVLENGTLIPYEKWHACQEQARAE